MNMPEKEIKDKIENDFYDIKCRRCTGCKYPTDKVECKERFFFRELTSARMQIEKLEADKALMLEGLEGIFKEQCGFSDCVGCIDYDCSCRYREVRELIQKMEK
jgi:hypothetical protein